MKAPLLLRLISAASFPFLLSCTGVLYAQVTPVPGDPLTGNGNVTRSVLTYAALSSSTYGTSPVSDSTGFALPANAAAPTQSFEGTLTLGNLTNNSFTKITDLNRSIGSGDSPWKHLPAFSFQFVQNGSHIIPVRQGLIYTGNADWNYLIGPGRVWMESGDNGYMRASMPIAVVQRNQNCVHNGSLTFLFSNSQTPKVSNAYYQVTVETCYTMKFDMWGMASATYTPGSVPNSTAIQNAEAAEIAGRLPTKPFSALATDYPNAGLVLSNFIGKYTCASGDPQCVTTYGLVINGTHYAAGTSCATRWGNYAFCDELRLPSYSTAKTAFANVALTRLGQIYGTSVYNQLISSWITPAAGTTGNWTQTTFNDNLDMASGNYNLKGYESDENGLKMTHFLNDEVYANKVSDAFVFDLNSVTPDTLWIYHSSDTFLGVSAMNLYLQNAQGSSADLFNQVLNDVYVPLGVSQGFRSMLRTDNSATGHPTGYYGLFYNQDDIARLANWLNTGGGIVNGAQVLEPGRLTDSLFRNPQVTGLTVPVSGDSNFFYKNSTWGKTMTPAQFPQYSCTFRVAFMSGYGGITVLMLPNGVSYYVFSDNNQFYWYDAVNEINKFAPMC